MCSEEERERLEKAKKVIPEIAYYLELLKQEAFSETQKAVEKRDEGLLRAACEKVGVPEKYIPAIIRILLKERPIYG